jgi:hypothetical protein
VLAMYRPGPDRAEVRHVRQGYQRDAGPAHHPHFG